MSRDTKETANEMLIMAVCATSLEKVAQAIALGADVNFREKEGNPSALETLLVERRIVISPEREQKTCEIVKLLLQEELRMGLNASRMDGLDHIIVKSFPVTPLRLSLVAETVVAVLAQQIEKKEPVHQIGFDRIYFTLGEITAEEDMKKGNTDRKDVMDSLERIHNRVCRMIREDEDNINAKFLRQHPKETGFWALPFVRPDTDSLPRPTQPYIDARERHEDAFNSATSLKNKNLPPEMQAVLKTDRQSAQKDLDRTIVRHVFFKPK